MSPEAPTMTAAPTISLETATPQTFSPNLGPQIPNEAGFNFNPSYGVDLKIQTYTAPVVVESAVSTTADDEINVPNFDLDIASEQAHAITNEPSVFDLPKFEYKPEQSVKEIELPESLREVSTPLSENVIEPKAEAQINEQAIAQVIQKIQAEYELDEQDEALWVQRFQNILDEKREEAEFLKPEAIIQKEPSEITFLPSIFNQTQTEAETNLEEEQARIETQTDEVFIMAAPRTATAETNTSAQTEIAASTQPDTMLATNVEPQTQTEIQPDLEISDQLPEAEDEDEKVGKPQDKIEVMDQYGDLFEVVKIRQVRLETLKDRLFKASTTVREAEHKQDEAEKIISGRLYRIDMPRLKDEEDIANNVLEFPILESEAAANIDPDDLVKTNRAISEVIVNKPPMETVVKVKYKGKINLAETALYTPINLGSGTVEQKTEALKKLHSQKAA